MLSFNLKPCPLKELGVMNKSKTTVKAEMARDCSHSGKCGTKNHSGTSSHGWCKYCKKCNPD
jgi:hypothetical protein